MNTSRVLRLKESPGGWFFEPYLLQDNPIVTVGGSVITVYYTYALKLGLSKSLLHVVSALLLQHHDLESFKVQQLSAALSRGQLLGPRGGGPLGVDARGGPSLVHGAGSGALGDLDHQGGQGDPGERDRLAGDLGAVDEDALLVDDFDDGGKLGVVDEDDAANFDQSPVSGFDGGVRHGLW